MALTLKASMSNSQQTFEHERRRASQPDIKLSVVKPIQMSQSRILNKQRNKDF